MENSRISLIKIHGAVLLFGIAGLFGKWITLPSSFITWGRCVFAFVALFVIILFSKERFALKQTSHYVVLAGLGLILALHWWAFFYAIQTSTVAIGLLTFSTFPVFTVFLEPLFFRDRIKWMDIAAAMVTFIGFVVMIPTFDIGNSHTLGAIIGTFSGLSFSVLQILNRKYVQIYSGKLITFYQTGVAAVILLPAVSLGQGDFSTTNVLLLAVLGVLCTAVAHSLFIGGLRTVKVQVASIIASLEPVYGIIAALLLLHEMPSWREICGGVIILTVAVWISSPRTPKGNCMIEHELYE